MTHGSGNACRRLRLHLHGWFYSRRSTLRCIRGLCRRYCWAHRRYSSGMCIAGMLVRCFRAVFLFYTGFGCASSGPQVSDQVRTCEYASRTVD